MEKNNQEQGIIKFFKKVEKLNRVTLIVIIIIYLATLILIGGLTVKERTDYSVDINYEHRIERGINDIIETQIIIIPTNSKSTVTETDKNGKTIEVEKVSTSYSISTTIATKNDEQFKKSRIMLMGTSLNGLVGYIVQYGGVYQLKSGDPNYNNSLHGYSGNIPYQSSGVTNNVLNENGIKKINGNILYTNSAGVQKEYTYEEEIFQLKEKDMRLFTEVTNTVEFNSFVTIENKITSSPSTNGYGVKLNFEVNKDANGNLYKTGHVDIQTWFVDNHGNIYPFVGIYGYNKQLEKMNISRNQAYIRDYMKARYVYIETRYYKYISAEESPTRKEEYQLIVDRKKVNFITLVEEYEAKQTT